MNGVLGEEFDDLRRELEHAMDRAVQETYEEALRMSSGPYSLRDMAVYFGHPFSKRHTSPAATGYPLDPAVINIQTGRFYSAWKQFLTTCDGLDVHGGIFNDSPEADFLKAAGTPKSPMVFRPIELHLQNYLLDKLALYLGEPVEAILAS